MSIAIAGVQYLYSRLDYESWSNKTGYKTWKRNQNLPNIVIIWTSIFPFYEVRHVFLCSCLAIPANRAIFVRRWRHLILVGSNGYPVSRSCRISRLPSDGSRNSGFSHSNQILVSTSLANFDLEESESKL
jgi:hypothetical protein